MEYEIHYTEQYKTRIVADSPEEALQKFQEGDFPEGEYVEGTTEIVGEVEDADQSPIDLLLG